MQTQPAPIHNCIACSPCTPDTCPLNNSKRRAINNSSEIWNGQTYLFKDDALAAGWRAPP